MLNFFLWLAGSDKELLDKCPKFEKIKHAGFGTLVLIPAILAFFSMTYAISTLTDLTFLYIGAGFCWAIIVLFIDRFIVSSLFKKKEKDISFWVSFATRFIFALFVGIAVSHPVVLLFFENSINQQLTEDYINLNDSIFQENQVKIDIISEKNKKLRDEIYTRIERKDCLEKLLTAEQSGTKVNLDCGSSSGMPTYGRRAGEIKEQIKNAEIEIKELQSQFDKIIQQNDIEIDKLEKRRQEQLNNISSNFSKDYLSRVKALDKIAEKNGSHVTRVKWFIILFFIFVDILPVTMKAATPRGCYEELVESKIHEIKTMEEANRQVASDISRIAYQHTIKLKEEHKLKLDELNTITEIFTDFVNKQDGYRKKFHKIIFDFSKSVQEDDTITNKHEYIDYIINLRGTFINVLEKARERFENFITNYK